MNPFKKALTAGLWISLWLPPANAGSLFGSDTLIRPNRSYNVLHYKLDFRFDEAAKKVMGTATISFVPLKNKLDSIALHATELDVSSVVAGRTPLRFANDRKELTVFLDKSYSFDDTVSIAVSYSACPKRGLYFLAPDSLSPQRHAQIWSQGEDMDNRYWFPCWDYPNEKATSEVLATVKDSWKLVSNGKLLDVREDKKNRTKTYHWYQSKPHVSYLIMIAAGEYAVFTGNYRTVPLEYYVYKERAGDGQRSLAATPDVMKYLEEATGYPYPWDKFAQIYIDDFMWGGMENTSAVTLNTSYLIDRKGLVDFTADDVVAHEMAHQWFGDLVTTRDWTHLWLNEGFANYFEALYKRHAKGDDEFQLDMMGQAASVIGVERSEGRKPVVSNDSYTGNVYSKGAWVLAMLQNLVGEKEFFRAINYYLRKNAFTSVTTYDFQRAVEEVTGQNLDWFFTQWLFKAGCPQLEVSSAWDGTRKQLALVVRQTQTVDSLTGWFTLPLDIECTTSAGKSTRTVWISKPLDTIEIALPEKPFMVIVDKGMKILKSLKFDKSKEELVYQLLHAGDICDRINAVRSLKEFSSDSSVFRAFKQAALHDSFWAVRREAATCLGVMRVGDVRSALFEIYRDESSAVRTAAVAALDHFPSKDVASFLENAIEKDSSYLVQSSCLESLVKADSTAAFNVAARFAATESYRDILRRSALHALHLLGTPDAIPVASKYAQIGYPADIRGYALSVLRDVGEKNAPSRAFVFKLLNDPEISIRKNAINIIGMWGGEGSVAALKNRLSVETDDGVRHDITAAIDSISEK